VLGNAIIGGLTGGANSLVAVAKNLIKLGSKEAGEKILSSVVGKVASFFAPSSDLTLNGLRSRAIVNGSMGAVSGLSQLAFDKDAKASDVLVSILGSVVLGEAIHVSVKGMSSINLSKGIINGVGEIDKAIAGLKPNKEMSVLVNNVGEITVKTGNHSSEDGLHLLASISRNSDYTLTVKTSELADRIKGRHNSTNPYKVAAKDYLLQGNSLSEVDASLKIGEGQLIGNYNINNITYLADLESEPYLIKALSLLDPSKKSILAAGGQSYFIPVENPFLPKFYANKLVIGSSEQNDSALVAFKLLLRQALNVPDDVPDAVLTKLYKVAGLAHENGHRQDPVTLDNYFNQVKDSFQRSKVSNSPLDPTLSYEDNLLKIQKAYREIPAEKFADNWAINFLKKHGYEIFSDDQELQKFFLKQVK
jgi:hypothetical protein